MLRMVVLDDKKGVELNLPVRGTGIPWNDKRAYARVVSRSTYHLVPKNYQFSNRDSKR